MCDDPANGSAGAGIRFRGNEGMPAGSYLIMLSELPVAWAHFREQPPVSRVPEIPSSCSCRPSPRSIQLAMTQRGWRAKTGRS
jgi:hypothetical protein